MVLRMDYTEFRLRQWISLLLLILAQFYSFGESKPELRDTDGMLNELSDIQLTELKYFQYHYTRWRESLPRMTTLKGNEQNSNNTGTNSVQPGRLVDPVVPNFIMCYQCVGMLTDRGHRFGCTEDIELMDFDTDDEYRTIIPCYGSCMVTRKKDDAASTFVRSCHHETCTGTPVCPQRDGACFHCCKRSFCNKEYPENFLAQGPGNAEKSKHKLGHILLVTVTGLQFLISG